MAFEFMESFDPRNSELGKWKAGLAVFTYNLAIPRTGPACAECGVGDNLVRDVFETPTPTELIIGSAWRNAGLGPDLTNRHVIGEVDAGSGDPLHGVFQVGETGRIIAGKNNPNDAIGGQTVPGVIRENAWQFVETRVLIDNAVGEYEVFVDGIQVLLTVGVDSQDGGSGIASAYRLDGSNLSGSCFFDDVYVVTTTGAAPWNTFLGDGPVVALFPDADGLTIAWTPVPGPAPNFQYVDEAPPVTVDGVTDSVVGSIDVYSHDPCPAGTILGVQQTWYGQRDNTGVRLVRHRVESPDGGVVSESPDRSTVNGTYDVNTYLWNQNPNGPVNWTQATVDAAAFGYHLTF